MADHTIRYKLLISPLQMIDPILMIQIQQVQRIQNQTFLNYRIQRSLSTKARTMIHLQ